MLSAAAASVSSSLAAEACLTAEPFSPKPVADLDVAETGPLERRSTFDGYRPAWN